MNRKKWIAMSAAVLLIALIAGVAAFFGRGAETIDETENLIANGGFETADGDVPSGWGVGRWYWDEGVSYLSLSDTAYSGNHSVFIENVEENDARFTQTVSVSPNAWYRISCMVRAEGCAAGRNGAGISVENTFISSEYAYDTDGEWTRLVLYGKTASDQKSITVMCRLGGYGSLNVGRAWFDDVEVTRVAALPDGAAGYSLATTAPAASDDGQDGKTDITVWIWAVALAFILIAVPVCTRRLDLKNATYVRAALALVLAAGAVIRIILAVSVRGFEVDMNCFEGWAERMVQNGPWGFYKDWCDYPPGYMLILWPIGALRYLFGIAYDSPAHWLLIKLVPMTCDLLIGLFLMRIAREKLGRSSAVLLGAAYILNPATVFNSAVWGQVDCVLVLLLLIAIYHASRREWKRSITAFACAVLAKPQALMFAPIGLLALICEVVRSGKDRKRMLREIGLAVAMALGVMTLVILPFSLGQGRDPFSWAWEKYAGTLGEYNYITVNACNLYQLLNMNWRALDQSGAWTYVGWAAYALAFALAAWFYIKARDRNTLFVICAMVLSVIFAFGAKMHERYLYPVIGLLLAAYIIDRDARLLITAIVLSASAFLNAALVLQDTYLSSNRAIVATVSAVNTAAAPVLVWTAWDMCVRGRYIDVSKLPGREKKEDGSKGPVRENALLNMTGRDYAIMLAITLIYAAVAFVNLGSLKAPQTAWTSSASGESVTFELEDSSTFHMTYYGGICNSTFTVAFSEDGENWSEEQLAQYDQGEIFRWLWFRPQTLSDKGDFVASDSGYPMQTARYIRITAQKIGLVLHEVGFIDENGEPFSIVSVTGEGGDAVRGSSAQLLCDEQDTIPVHPSYYNSTYFDEIYHARTAYEFENSLYPYETTHPPLGKVLIMLGIEIFGMTPFGWRFMGALFGVLMLPVLYLLVKQLLKKTEYAAIATMLMALDAMHFTQTRIATIDTYGVFFILLMYLFMFRYCQMSFYYDRFWKTLVPLGLCGVAMGLGIASKWICVYAAVGLAVLLFYTLTRRYIEHRKACLFGGQTEPEKLAREKFWPYFIETGLFCVVMFIIVPALIYYFSYYWYMRPTGGLSFEKVWASQLSMFNYHKGLTGDTHFFKSPWYEWPLIIRPMWYYSGTEFMPEGYVSSISCMGNPAVWWTGLVALIFVIVQLLRRKGGRNYLYAVIGFAAQYLPWVLVPRSTFIYHYFASVPFIILCTVIMLRALRKRSEKAFRGTASVLIFAALALFVAFYPLESGLPVLRSYANWLRWFNWYNF